MVRIDAGLLGDNPGIAGASDPFALLGNLPAVNTSSELKAELNVRGTHSGANLFEADGARIVNPMHMLGLYSTFNSSFYSGYEFAPSRHKATESNATSALFKAHSPSGPFDSVRGEATVGVIECHGAVHVPVFSSKGLLSVGARHTWLGLLFPDILTLGTSHLDYGFTDMNASYTHFIGASVVKGSVFANRDKLKVVNRHNGSKDGTFGWGNIAASLSWQKNAAEATLSYSRFENEFRLSEAGRELNLPSSVSEVNARGRFAAGHFDFAAEGIWRHTSGQKNVALEGADLSDRSLDAFEGSLAAGWTHTFESGIDIYAGIRATVYACCGFTKFAPMPRLDIGYALSSWLRLHIAAGRYMKFDRLVEESTTGLPADFHVNATRRHLPEDSWAGEIGVSGKIPVVRIDFSVEAYAKSLRHCGEFAGSVLDMLNPSYDPLGDLLDGRGYSCGISVALSRQFGRLRGRVGYNLGRSRLKFDRFGDDYFPSAHDRLHDLTATLMWNPWRRLTLGATFTHATGTPYTQAKYGYMIGENLICEYFPHNSSRLPAYNRLDLSATLRVGRHSLSLSVYNALANRNILFYYTSYSLTEGITRQESVMKAVIPSLSYTIAF